MGVTGSGGMGSSFAPDAVPGWQPEPPDWERAPLDEELWELIPDPDTGPPTGPEPWPAGLADEVLAARAAAEVERLPPSLRAGRFLPASPYGAGFASGGAADSLAPGLVLAGLAEREWAGGLAQVSDDGLIGLIRAWRRLASWASAGEAAGIAELDRRRCAQVAAGADPHVAERVPDEIAAPLTLTMRAADLLTGFACRLTRLPRAMAALTAGRIDQPRAVVIVNELTGLDGPHAAAVEAAIIGQAPGQTTGQLRAAIRRAVLTADPAAARRRREEAKKEARVEIWDEQAGTAALAGRDLPAADVLAADKHLTSLARHLRASGAEGTIAQLRARAYTGLLLGLPIDSLTSQAAPATGAAATGAPVHAPAGGPAAAARGPAAAARGPAAALTAAPVTGQAAAPAAPGSVNLTMPLAAWLDGVSGIGEVPGFGAIPAEDAQALTRRIAAQPTARWCITLTSPSGRALAHGCAHLTASHPTASHPTASHRTAGSHPPRPGAGSPGPAAGSVAAAGDGGWELTVTIRPIADGGCTHQHESPGYRPSSRLRHLVTVRQRTCSYPGCRRDAARCDLDHTVPYGQGGRSCECNLAPLCRRHHRAKQAQGWRLDQPAPGVLVWTLPHGRSYRVQPGSYPPAEPAGPRGDPGAAEHDHEGPGGGPAREHGQGPQAGPAP
jgi:hypothetical protein